MRKLERGPAPTCLSKYRHGANNWNDLTADDKKELWQKLDDMQGQRCAYCEGELRADKRHIEHFRQKGRDPKVTFLWSNLFGSCNRFENCGKYKDELPPYTTTDLIKPDDEDPEHFFRVRQRWQRGGAGRIDGRGDKTRKRDDSYFQSEWRVARNATQRHRIVCRPGIGSHADG